MTAYSPTGYTGDGNTTDYTVSWPYLHSDHVECYLDGVETSLFSIPTVGLIRFDTAPSASVAISIKRNTPIDPLAVWNDGAIILGRDLNTAFNQALYIAEEAEVKAGEGITQDASSSWWLGLSKEIRDVADPTTAQSAATKAYVDANNSSTQAAAAAASAAAALVSEGNASTSEGNAGTYAVNAGLEADYAAEWANRAEDDLIPAAAGGDEVDDYSAKHHAAKAAASAASISLPLPVVSGGTGQNTALAGFNALKQTATDALEGVVELATAAEYRNKTAGAKALTPSIVYDAMAEVGLTDAATIAWNHNDGVDFTVTLAGNRTLGFPTNPKVGQKGRIRVVQDATGGRTLALAAGLETAGSEGIELSTAANAEDYLDYDVVTTGKIRIFQTLEWG